MCMHFNGMRRVEEHESRFTFPRYYYSLSTRSNHLNMTFAITPLKINLISLPPYLHNGPYHPPQLGFSLEMSLWVDKVSCSSSGRGRRADIQYRPRTLDDLHYHDGLSSRLKSLVSFECQVFPIANGKAASGDFPHILFYGPSGAGKKVSCRARVLLKS